ncbi:MAG: glycoside hydrolase family 13 protein [Defluviitaleaceae bacterium]|nr:glycoside hydrolase family 13 protein [Defluviitaleaceae bacterium]
MINKNAHAAIFSDETRNFISNPQPVRGEVVTISLRTFKGSVQAAKLVIQGRAGGLCLAKARSEGLFDYWQVKYKLDTPIRYHFALQAGGEHFVYNKSGYDFILIPDFDTPEWAQGAIMYQIFVDRFYNGEPENDVQDDQYTYLGLPAKRMNWDEPVEFLDIANFYGGDLAGILAKIGYLKDLGVEVIYLTPIFASPSSHKYDISDYEQVDPHFGDNELLANLISTCHDNGIKVILDGVFNHCGHLHKWVKRDEGYEDYLIWNGNQYEAWWGHDNHPKLNFEGSPELYEEMMKIGQMWVSKPYNADGWRLDVAADLGQSREFNHKFWRDFRGRVKAANPDAFILAEHYGDPHDWLDGTQWDSIMNYDAFMEPMSWFFTGMQKHSESYDPNMLNNGEGFKNAMDYFMAKLPYPALASAMNQLSNHDHSRFLTRTNMRAGRLHTHGRDAADSHHNLSVMLSAITMQFTWQGSPTIYYGDEAGLAGFTDPDNRRPYPWGSENQTLLAYHKEMSHLRKTLPPLRTGSQIFLHADHGTLAYARFDTTHAIICAYNNTPHDKHLALAAWRADIPINAKITRIILTTNNTFANTKTPHILDQGTLFITLPPHSSAIYHHEKKSEKI